MTIYVIIVGVPSLIAILIWLWKGIRFFSEHLMYSNLEIGSKEGIEGTTQFGETRIKLAYNGSSSLLVQGLRLKFSLKYPSRRKRALAFLQVAFGFLTNDIEGLKEMVGPRLKGLDETWPSRIFNLIYGLLWLLLVICLALSPFGWMLLLLAAPYDSRELIAGDREIQMVDAETTVERSRPFILEPRTEKTFILTFDYLFKSQNKPEGYPSDTKVEYLGAFKREPWWQLPRTGQGLWIAEGVLFVQTKSKLRTYSVSLGAWPVRLLPPHNT